jgi:hypothetical protein
MVADLPSAFLFYMRLDCSHFFLEKSKNLLDVQVFLKSWLQKKKAFLIQKCTSHRYIVPSS